MPRKFIMRPDPGGKLAALAENIAAVLHDPLTPPRLREAIADGLCEAYNYAPAAKRLETEQSPEMIALVLAACAGGEEGGAR